MTLSNKFNMENRVLPFGKSFMYLFDNNVVSAPLKTKADLGTKEHSKGTFGQFKGNDIESIKSLFVLQCKNVIDHW